MSRVLNAAFIGCGAIAQKKHLPLCAADENIRIKMLFDVDQTASEKCCKEFGSIDTKVVDTVDDIVSNDNIDVVFVATPNSTHAEFSIKSLQSGKHVICEKPMSLTGAEADAMLRASVESKRMLHISYQNRYTNQAQYVKRLAREGFFSDIYYAKAYAIRRRAVPTWGVMTNKAFSGGGPLIDIGSHALDLAMWLSDNFQPHYAIGKIYNKIASRGSEANFWGEWSKDKMDVEDCALGFIVMKNGMTLTVDATYALNASKEFEASVDLFGVTGGAELRQQSGVTLVHEFGGKMCISQNDLQMTQRSLTPANINDSPALREHKDFVSRLLAGDNFDASASEACVVSKIIDALYRSAREECPIYFE